MAVTAMRCWCNICGVSMATAKPVQGSNFCGPTCRDIDRIVVKEPMKHHPEFCRKAWIPVALRMQMKL